LPKAPAKSTLPTFAEETFPRQTPRILLVDGIALGSPTNYGSVCWQMKQWWDPQPLENWEGAM
jgi:multimeric flavodoxin WrbA